MDNIEDLKLLGFVTIPYPKELRARVEEVFSSWQKFCTLPEEEKTKLTVGDRVNGFGYARRRDKGATADNKELFEVRRLHMPELTSRAETFRETCGLKFMYQINTLIEAVTPVVTQFARATENHFGVWGLEKAVRETAHRWYFRYLHYMPGSETLANPHADNGGFTLHLHESHPGGEFLSLLSREWQKWPVDEQNTIIFPSMGLQYASRGDLKALWHRVRATEETKSVDRFSMVTFIDFTRTHKWDVARRRIQDLPVGFNYAQPFQEFEKYFIPAEE